MAPTIDNPITEPVTAKLSDTRIEFDDVSFFDLRGDPYSVVAAQIDLRGSRLTWKIVEEYPGAFANVDDATGFNGYELSFPDLGGNSSVKLYSATLVKGSDTLGITADGIGGTGSRLYLNVDGLAFSPGEGFALDLGFRIKGGGRSETLTGDGGRDSITGGGGDDRLLGARGDDRLRGGLGSDTLKGGGGDDRFVFKTAAESTVRAAGRDTILDFHHGDDRIDLRGIDANENRRGDQKFHFISDHAFSNEAGELRAVERSSGTYVQGDTDGDGHADFAIKLAGDIHLVKADFLL